MSDFDPTKLFDVKGLVAVITGGGTGIGLMLAQALEANGAIIYILGRRKEVLEKAAGTAKHGNIHPIQCDVTSKTSLAAAAEQVASRTGFVNLLIANSGITGPTLRNLSQKFTIEELSDMLNATDTEAFNETFVVNTTAVFSTVAAFLVLLGKGNEKGNVPTKSQIVAVTSAAAFSRSPMTGFAYGPSKAAATHMLKQMSTLFVNIDIRANILAPGVYPSDMTASFVKETYPKEFIPAQRHGSVEDMAGAILYLAGRAGGFLNGSVLLTDGGRLSIVPATY